MPLSLAKLLECTAPLLVACVALAMHSARDTQVFGCTQIQPTLQPCLYVACTINTEGVNCVCYYRRSKQASSLPSRKIHIAKDSQASADAHAGKVARTFPPCSPRCTMGPLAPGAPGIPGTHGPRCPWDASVGVGGGGLGGGGMRWLGEWGGMGGWVFLQGSVGDGEALLQ